MQEVDESPLVRRITIGELKRPEAGPGIIPSPFPPRRGEPSKVFEVGAIIACLDGQMLNQGSDFGHDGKTVICHTEIEEMIWTHGVPSGENCLLAQRLRIQNPGVRPPVGPNRLVHCPVYDQPTERHRDQLYIQPLDGNSLFR